jgi:hypothetical protein
MLLDPRNQSGIAERKRPSGGSASESRSHDHRRENTVFICGHTEEIAKEHYWTVEDSDLDNVIDKLTPDLSQKLAIKLAIDDVSCGPKSSLGVSTPKDDETKKAQEIPGFVSLCRLLSSRGFSLTVGDIGLEPTTSTMSTLRSNQLS